MGLEVRGLAAGEGEAYLHSIFNAFGKFPTEEELSDEGSVLEVDRALVVEDGGRFVATAGAFSFGMTVPGGASVPVAGVTAVGVLPTHRRRGLLRAMMARQLDDVAARGEAVAVLTASDAGIYGRFGYGLAARILKVDLDTRGGLPLRVEPRTGGRLRLVDGADAQVHALRQLHQRVQPDRVGELSRSDAWWTYVGKDRESWREGASARFCVVHEDESGAIDGGCWYRIKEGAGDDAIGRGEVRIWELVAADAEVEAALLVYLAGIDLTWSVTGWVRPVDDPWLLRVADIRRYRIQLVHDHLYVRVLDVPSALAARTYEGHGSLVLAVDDPFRPASGGRFRLEVDEDGSVACERVGGDVDGVADLRLDAAALGSLHLGDVAPSVLAAAGRLAPASPEALRLADRVFPTARAPFCTLEF